MQPLIDTHIHLSRWPCRRLPLDETANLVEALQSRGVIQAWAGSFDALLHNDIAGVNGRLAEECRRHASFLIPFGSVNPMLPDWQEDLRRCHEQFRMPGVRLHPNYHGYRLDDPVFGELLRQCAERKLAVQLSVLMEDKRVQHRLLPVPPVDLAPLPEAMKRAPGVKLQLLNAFQVLRGELLLRLAAAGVCFETATIEGVGGVHKVLGQIPQERLLFGSHAPFFVFESAKLKLAESDLTAEQMKAVCEENARRFISL